MISIGSRCVPRTEPAFFISLLSFFKPLVLMLLPQQMADTLHNRLIEDMQHLAANIEGPKLPQVQSALSLLVDTFTVASPPHSDVQMNTEVFIFLHHLHFRWLFQSAPKSGCL
ncbi:hypothetical protein ATANTOWER_007665 [Ataeniobius toweri]|uniref:Uncharacterized protein n=1 Tax=Ataeniobius toweri TaxID=208326 RepID=A0ABU7AMS5_9TELE|nr:hypothetical protein [Ataeniobius toweri]